MPAIVEPPTLGPVTTLTERLAAEMASRILDGSIAPGQRIIEASFASEFGVSHSPIRDAFRILNKHGLVDISPRRGVRVAPMRGETLRGVAQLLSMLTLLAVRRWAEQGRADWPAGPAAILDDCAAQIDALAAATGKVALDPVLPAITQLCDRSASPGLAAAIAGRIAQYRFLTANHVDSGALAGTIAAWRDLADAVRNDAARDPLFPVPSLFPVPAPNDGESRAAARAFGDVAAAPLPNFPEIQAYLDDIDHFVLPDVREHPTLPGQIAARIRELIHAGDYVFGERITETELAERFLTSRGPVRDAIRILDEQGLVEIRSRRGAIVRKLPPDQLGELYDIRDGVAIMVARLAAERGPPDKRWRDLFAQGLTLMATWAVKPDLKPIVWIEMRRALSKLVYSLAGNEPASRLASEIENQLATHYVVQGAQAGRVQIVEGWRAVGEAIERSDPAAAAQAFHAMIVRSKRQALESITRSDARSD